MAAGAVSVIPTPESSRNPSMNFPKLPAALLAAAILLAVPAWAGEGHDHGVDLTRVIELLKVALGNKACCRHGNAASQ